MARLLHELSGHEVNRVWMESRQDRLNRADLQIVNTMRTRKDLRRELRVEFARPLTEPLLWVPDAVAGAVAIAWKANDRRYTDLLTPALEEIEL